MTDISEETTPETLFNEDFPELETLSDEARILCVDRNEETNLMEWYQAPLSLLKWETWPQWPQWPKWDRGAMWPSWPQWDKWPKWDQWAQWPQGKEGKQGKQWPEGNGIADIWYERSWKTTTVYILEDDGTETEFPIYDWEDWQGGGGDAVIFTMPSSWTNCTDLIQAVLDAKVVFLMEIDSWSNEIRYYYVTSINTSGGYTIYGFTTKNWESRQCELTINSQKSCTNKTIVSGIEYSLYDFVTVSWSNSVAISQFCTKMSTWQDVTVSPSNYLKPWMRYIFRLTNTDSSNDHAMIFGGQSYVVPAWSTINFEFLALSTSSLDFMWPRLVSALPANPEPWRVYYVI